MCSAPNLLKRMANILKKKLCAVASLFFICFLPGAGTASEEPLPSAAPAVELGKVAEALSLSSATLSQKLLPPKNKGKIAITTERMRLNSRLLNMFPYSEKHSVSSKRCSCATLRMPNTA